MIDDRSAVGGADDAVIGDRKSTAAQLRKIDLPLPGFLGEGSSLSG